MPPLSACPVHSLRCEEQWDVMGITVQPQVHCITCSKSHQARHTVQQCDLQCLAASLAEHLRQCDRMRSGLRSATTSATAATTISMPRASRATRLPSRSSTTRMRPLSREGEREHSTTQRLRRSTCFGVETGDIAATSSLDIMLVLIGRAMFFASLSFCQCLHTDLAVLSV